MKPTIFNQKNRKDVFNMKRLYSNIPPVMTRKDLQDILQISKNTALELLQTKQIDSFMIKGRYRITKESLVRFIENSSFYH